MPKLKCFYIRVLFTDIKQTKTKTKQKKLKKQKQQQNPTCLKLAKIHKV